MPVASSWVRPGTQGDKSSAPAPAKPSSAAQKESIHNSTAQTQSAEPAAKQHKKPPVKKKPAKAGVWTPALAAERAAKAAQEAAANKSKREAEAAEKAAAEAAAKAKEAELQAQLAKLKQEKEALRLKRERVEKAKQQEAEAAFRNERKAAAQRREAGTALANGMQTSEKLKRKRTEYEEQNREEIARRAKEAEARRRLEAALAEQSQLIAHIMTRHATYFDLLQIPEGSSADAVKRARKNLSFRVHPDRCSHDNAKEAFHRINEAADALLQRLT